MKKALLGLSLFVACLFVAGSVWAETVKGTVAKVEADEQSLEITTTDAAGAKSSEEVSVNGSTKYTGVAGLSEIKDGSSVDIDATKDAATGKWMANSVTVSPK